MDRPKFSVIQRLRLELQNISIDVGNADLGKLGQQSFRMGLAEARVFGGESCFGGEGREVEESSELWMVAS